ncbi:MAG TPA: hypothetical protein VFT19_13895 [Solirubrobacterales bacterium]|nr:hypothetical protein [Solirubrobacterales bacterium]
MAIRDRLLPNLSSERGFAVPTVMLAMLASFGLGTAVVVSSVGAQKGTVRDQNTKAALGAAEAGVANALLRFNRIEATSPCTPVGGSATGAGGWCPVNVSGPIDRGEFTYAVRPTETELEIVSVGSVDGATRRVNAIAQSAQGGEKGLAPFGEASVVGLDGILLNANATINASVATNGDIGLNSQSKVICESAQVGVGHGLNPNNNGTVTCPVAQGTTTLPPVNPGNVANENSNDRICKLDPLTPASDCSWAWNSSQKTLILNSGAALTLGASGGEFNYYFCQIILNSNSYLHIAGGAKVRIYFGAPEDCNNQSSPLIINSNSKIQPTGAGAPDLAILVLGSEKRNTYINLNSNAILFNCDQSFVLYAPRTQLTINSNTHVCGGVAAKSIIVNSKSSISASNNASEFELPNTESQYFLGYGQPEFVECTSTAAASPPDSGC